MNVQGTVVDNQGRILPGAKVEILDPNRNILDYTTVDENGKFELAGEGSTFLRVFPPFWGSSADKVSKLPWVHRIEGVPRPKAYQVEIALPEATAVPLIVYDPQGRKLEGRTECKQFNPEQFGFFDLQEMPATGSVHWEVEDSMPHVVLPTGKTRCFQVLWTTPTYGRVICNANNSGRGFVAQEQSQIFLNVELALTAWQRLVAEIDESQRGGYALGESVYSLRDKAAWARRQMEEATDEREVAKWADTLLDHCLHAGEQLVLQRAEQRIERQRKVQIPLQLASASKDHSGITVKYRQLTHDFHFGVFVNPNTHPLSRVPLQSSPLWQRLQEMGVNLLPLPLIWSRLEPEQDNRRDEEENSLYPVEELSQAGFSLKDHISVWFWQGRYPDQWGTFTPDWTYQLDAAQITEAVTKHMKTLINRMYPYVKDWQAINEPMLAHTNCLNLDLPTTVELLKSVVKTTKTEAPDSCIEVNSCQVFGEMIQPSVREQGYELVPDEFYRSLRENGVDFDVVGMQLYYGGYMASKLFSGGFPIRHPWDLEKIIKRYTRLGKPIRVTEVSVPSSYPDEEMGLDFGWWHEKWDLNQQAKWVEYFYTLCYSLPQVEEITWWNATDEGAFIKDGGLMFADYTPKPAAHSLQTLTTEWLTRGETAICDGGLGFIHGASGEYEILVEKDGEQICQTRVRINTQSREPVSITID